MRAVILIAALPMYDWPEVRHETDEDWHNLRAQFVNSGIPVCERLVRKNADMPPVPGGIRSPDGTLVAPDPARLPPDEFDVHTLWRHPGLVFAQTCWGPLEQGLADHVRVVGQPDYSAFQGGDGIYYRSAILMRRNGHDGDVNVPEHSGPSFDAAMLRNRRFTYNGSDSMSGLLALRRDLVALGALKGEADFPDFWSETSISGAHRQSVINLAEGKADVAAIDCRTLDLCRRFEPALKDLRIAGWTARRKGLPYITSRTAGYAINLSSSG